MKRAALGYALAAFLCAVASGAAAQVSAAPPGNAEGLNTPISAKMTCGQLLPLIRGKNHSAKIAAGSMILWFEGYYSGRSGVAQIPAGWLRTISQGVGGTCAIDVNASRPVLDVIAQLHREYGRAIPTKPQ